jgi:hypothetical protein
VLREALPGVADALLNIDNLSCSDTSYPTRHFLPFKMPSRGFHLDVRLTEYHLLCL